MNSREFVIGDIHGGLRGLIQILGKANITKDDTLIFLGDYVDGWSESAQTISYLIELESQFNCIFIKGNHDTYLLDWLRENKAEPTWLHHGGANTVASYVKCDYGSVEKLKHIQFLERTRNYYVDTQNRLFIHAGFTSMHGPEKEFSNTYHQWDRTLWEMALTMDKHILKDSKFFPKRLLLFHEIYIRHTPTLNYGITVPMQGCNVWNVDTGAGFYGPLTMMEINSKDYFQSDPLTELYPSEKGRNK